MGVPFLILNIITFLSSWTQTKLQMEADSKYIHIFFSIQSGFFFFNSLMETLHFHSFIHTGKRWVSHPLSTQFLLYSQ